MQNADAHGCYLENKIWRMKSLMFPFINVIMETSQWRELAVPSNSYR